MSNQDIERATTSTADMVAAGLEQHARAITARVISLLGEDRAHFTKSFEDFETMLGAIAIETADARRESNEGQAALIAGLRGLAQDVSVVSTSVEGAIRGQKKLSREFVALNKRMTASEADRLQINERLARIEALLAARPALRDAEHKALMDAIVERRGDGDPRR